MTLPESFKHFFCAWESTAKEQQTLENLTSRLVMEEARMSSHSTSTSVALVAKQKARKPNQRAPKPGRCFACNQHGHWKRECPKKNAIADQKRWTGSKGEVRRGDALICNVDEKGMTGSSSEAKRGNNALVADVDRWAGTASEEQRDFSADNGDRR